MLAARAAANLAPMKVLRPLARLAAATVLALAACGDDGAATPSDTLVADTVVTDTADATAPDDTVADTESDTASPPDAADDTSPDAADTSAPAELDGFDRAAASVRVAARHWPDNPAQTVVVGTLWAADPPQGFALDATDGACRLSFGVNPFCSTPCEDGLCTAPDVCTPWPLNASAGDLRVAGGAADWSYRHAVSGYGAAYDETPFAGDDVITVSAPGGADFPAFSGAVAFPPPIEAVTSTEGMATNPSGSSPITGSSPSTSPLPCSNQLRSTLSTLAILSSFSRLGCSDRPRMMSYTNDRFTRACSATSRAFIANC